MNDFIDDYNGDEMESRNNFEEVKELLSEWNLNN